MGRIDSCIYSLRALREVIVEDRNLHGEALRGRAYARQKLSTISRALEELDTKKSTAIEVVPILHQWYAHIGVTEMPSPNLSEQVMYALECARVCHTEAEISENQIMRSVLIDLVSVLVRFAGWLDMYPSGSQNEKV